MAQHEPGQPSQHQEQQPGRESEMEPRPSAEREEYRGSGKLRDRVALITGGDSGIGRAVALAFAKEGADSVIVYLDEHDDARWTKERVEELGRRCEAFSGDIGDPEFCRQVVRDTLDAFGRLDCLVNNAGEQHVRDSVLEIGPEQLEKTFRTNIFSMFFLTQAALPQMREGSTIINTTSVTAYEGNPKLIDYSATKGAIVAFTRSLSLGLAEQGIRVNGVAPGPIWTPLIPATFDEEHVEKFGTTKPMGRAGEPDEVAPCYVFLASSDSSYMSGQVLHPNGGTIVGS